MTERQESGVLDTSVFIDLESIDPMALPVYPELTAITLAELNQGLAMARSTVAMAERTERLGEAIVGFEALPFDSASAARFGTMVALTIAAGRDPRPRRTDLMIAATASVRGLPLYTRNANDFVGLDDMVQIVAV